MKFISETRAKVLSVVLTLVPVLAGCGVTSGPPPSTGAAASTQFPPAAIGGLSRLSDQQAYFLWDANGHDGLGPTEPTTPPGFVDAFQAMIVRSFPETFGISQSTVKSSALYNYAKLDTNGMATPTATPSVKPRSLDPATGTITQDWLTNDGLLSVEIYTLNDDFVVDRDAVITSARNAFSDSAPQTDIQNALYNPDRYIGIGKHRMILGGYGNHEDPNSLAVMKEFAKVVQDSGVLD